MFARARDHVTTHPAHPDWPGRSHPPRRYQYFVAATDSSAPASVRDDEPCDAEVHPGPECAHPEATVQGGGRLGGYGELDGARDDLAPWAADAPGRSEIQVEDRLRLTADGRCNPLRNRIDDEVGKRDTLAAVAIGQPAGVINRSSERRYDNLATADREEQRRLRGCRGDGGD